MSLDLESESATARRETRELAEHIRDGRRNEQLITNMKKYTDMSDADVDEFAYFMVAADYFKQPDHRGGVVEQGTNEQTALNTPSRTSLSKAS